MATIAGPVQSAEKAGQLGITRAFCSRYVPTPARSITLEAVSMELFPRIG
jgi:hypothetical protein